MTESLDAWARRTGDALLLKEKDGIIVELQHRLRMADHELGETQAKLQNTVALSKRDGWQKDKIHDKLLAIATTIKHKREQLHSNHPIERSTE